MGSPFERARATFAWRGTTSASKRTRIGCTEPSRDATGLVADRNTVVNATAGGIISESSWGTIVRRNLVFMNYPGPKSVAEDYPRGIETEKGSNKTVVAENVIHTFHWGIQVGSEGGSIYSNII